MARETIQTMVDAILNHLVNLTSLHELEARETFPAAIALARSINYSNVARVTPLGRTRLTHARDSLAQWLTHQYAMSPTEASRHALDGTWPSEAVSALRHAVESGTL